jgi:hypothetical protein
MLTLTFAFVDRAPRDLWAWIGSLVWRDRDVPSHWLKWLTPPSLQYTLLRIRIAEAVRVHAATRRLRALRLWLQEITWAPSTVLMDVRHSPRGLNQVTPLAFC